MEVKLFKQDLINKKYADSIKFAIDDLINGNSPIVNTVSFSVDKETKSD